MNYVISLAEELKGAWAAWSFCLSLNCDSTVAFHLVGLLAVTCFSSLA